MSEPCTICGGTWLANQKPSILLPGLDEMAKHYSWCPGYRDALFKAAGIETPAPSRKEREE
jgi:hypothetical protein